VLVEDTMDQVMKNPTVRDVYLGKLASRDR
jgi:ABC-type uncharacterized transport system ATPase subunit